MRTTRVYECSRCHQEIREAGARGHRSGEFEEVTVTCPSCGAETTYRLGTSTAEDSPHSAIVPCRKAGCDTVVEAFGVTRDFVAHVQETPKRHDLHR